VPEQRGDFAKEPGEAGGRSGAIHGKNLLRPDVGVKSRNLGGLVIAVFIIVEVIALPSIRLIPLRIADNGHSHCGQWRIDWRNAQDGYDPNALAFIVLPMLPSIAKLSLWMARKLEHFNNPFPNSLALQRVQDRLGAQMSSLAVVELVHGQP